MAAAPNPRRVRVFAAEKGIRIPSVTVDLRAGDHRKPEFLKKNPSGKIPVLELDDGTCIPESIAICRFLEAAHPEPNLFGRVALESAHIEAANRQLEFELLGPIGVVWRNSDFFAKAFPGRRQIPDARAEAEDAVRAFYARLDGELADRAFLAGSRFTVADITGLCVIDFAREWIDLSPDPVLASLWRWHGEVSARPSAQPDRA